MYVGTWVQGPAQLPPRVWACVNVCAEPRKTEAIRVTISGCGRAQAGLGALGKFPDLSVDLPFLPTFLLSPHC